MTVKKKKVRKDFKLDVYGEEFDVLYVSGLVSPHNGKECCGLCDSEERKIYINKAMGDQCTAITILHELFHAYARRMGMENSGMTHELEELIADQFGKLLAENFDFDF